MLTQEYEPTLGHHFIKRLQDEGILLQNLTQNIDDLEIKAGVSEEKLLQAHGHSRTAHCIDCNKQADIKEWKELAAKEVPMRCKECEGLIKPDIVFFGEQLPESFFSAPATMKKADLAIIIGTSLQVNPFAYLAQLIPKSAPIVLINRDDVVHRKDLKLWMEGDIQDNVAKLMQAIGWKQ